MIVRSARKPQLACRGRAFGRTHYFLNRVPDRRLRSPAGSRRKCARKVKSSLLKPIPSLTPCRLPCRTMAADALPDQWCRTLSSRSNLQNQRLSKVQRHFLTQPALMTNAIAVTHKEHPDRQLGIHRGPCEAVCRPFAARAYCKQGSKILPLA
jgi:hypothetical protein